jgi:superfamily II DNA or RNA helicase
MKFELINPTQAYVKDATDEEINSLHKELRYTNTANAALVKRHYNKIWLKRQDPELWTKELEILKGDVNKTLVFEDSIGRRYIRPGYLPYLEMPFVVENSIRYPVPKKIAWAKPLPFKLHDYQQQSVEKLLAVKHGSVELCTGAGKSAILLSLCRETGFKTAIVAPSKSIFFELLEKFETHLGKGNVGTFGSGRKKIGKRFTICIADSLVNVKPGSEEWDFFNGLDMALFDESHTLGAETLEAMCHGVFSHVPYRFFVSGTQTRGDGAKKLLQSIIGPTVHKLTTKEAVTGGYISPHSFVVVDLESSNPNFSSRDSIAMKRAHFLNNRNIAAFAAKLANADAMLNGRQTLILVDELSQISMLLPLLKVPYAYAHSDANTARLKAIGLERVDSKESVDKFNRGEVKVLIGTSCIATGTNIFPTHNTVNWVGGTSEIRTKQGAVGRSVRLLAHSPWASKCIPKTGCKIYDFNVFDQYLMTKHLDDRLTFYKESGSEIKHIKI